MNPLAMKKHGQDDITQLHDSRPDKQAGIVSQAIARMQKAFYCAKGKPGSYTASQQVENPVPARRQKPWNLTNMIKNH